MPALAKDCLALLRRTPSPQITVDKLCPNCRAINEADWGATCSRPAARAQRGLPCEPEKRGSCASEPAAGAAGGCGDADGCGPGGCGAGGAAEGRATRRGGRRRPAAADRAARKRPAVHASGAVAAAAAASAASSTVRTREPTARFSPDGKLRDWRLPTHVAANNSDLEYSYEVKVIVGKRTLTTGQRAASPAETVEYQVQWAATSGSTFLPDHSWVPAAQCAGCPQLIEQFESTGSRRALTGIYEKLQTVAMPKVLQQPDHLDPQIRGSVGELKPTEGRTTSSAERKVLAAVRPLVEHVLRAAAPDDESGLAAIMATRVSNADRISAAKAHGVDPATADIGAGGGLAGVLESMRKIKPSERVHLTAYFAADVKDPLTGRRHTLPSLNAALGSGQGTKPVGREEYRKAAIHAVYPGAGLPDDGKEELHRQGVSDAKMLRFWTLIGTADKFQGFAHNFRTEHYSSGQEVEMDNVDRLQMRTRILAEYLMAVDAESTADVVPPDEERCRFECSKTHRRCMNPIGCESSAKARKHKITPSDAISRATVYMFLKKCSAGDMTSLEGLDDIVTDYGPKNFAAMQRTTLEMRNYLCAHTATVAEATVVRVKCDKLIRDIEATQIYYKGPFQRSLARESECCSHCLSCNFHDDDDDQIPCQYRRTHTASCASCNLGDGLLERMVEIAEASVAKASAGGDRVQMDDAYTWADDIEGEFSENFEMFKAHVAVKASEEEYATAEDAALPYHTAILTSDFKQRLMNALYRMGMRNYYGQASVASLLGYMMTSNKPREGGCRLPGCTTAGCDSTLGLSPTEPMEKEVRFVVMLSNDLKQDGYFVSCGDHHVQTDWVKEKAPHVAAIRMRKDGAGYFRSNFSRCATVLFGHEWEGCLPKEADSVTPPGGGKTKLDSTCFSRTSNALAVGLSSGIDRTDADSAIATITAAGGMAATTVLKITPLDRPEDKERTRMDIKNQYLRMTTEVDPAGGVALRGYRHSGFGGGHLYRAADIKQKWTGGTPPPAPSYEIGVPEASAVRKRDACAALSDADRAAQATQARSRKRVKAAGGTARVRQRETRRQERGDAGLHQCDCLSETGHHCLYVSRFPKWLQKHKDRGRHLFPGRTSADAFVKLVSAPDTDANAGVMRMEKGSRPNVGKDALVEAGPAPPAAEVQKRTAEFKCGRYSKRRRKETYRKPGDLLLCLEDLFQRGERVGKKVKPEAARAEMRDKREVAETCGGDQARIGMRYFSSRSTHGRLLPVNTIKSWFSIRTQLKNKSAREAAGADGASEDAQIDAMHVPDLEVELVKTHGLAKSELAKLKRDGVEVDGELRKNKAALVCKVKELRACAKVDGENSAVADLADLEDLDDEESDEEVERDEDEGEDDELLDG